MKSPDEINPIVISTDGESGESAAYRTDPRFAFYDEDFPVDEKYLTEDPSRPMRLPNLSVHGYGQLILGNTYREWIRHRIEHSRDTIDGKPFPYKVRTTPDGTQQRALKLCLTIPDMERLNYAFLQHGQIDGQRYARANKAIRALAEVVGVLPRRGQGLSEAEASSMFKSAAQHICPECSMPYSTAKGLAIHVTHAHERPAAKPKARHRAPRKGDIPTGGLPSGAFQIVFSEADAS